MVRLITIFLVQFDCVIDACPWRQVAVSRIAEIEELLETNILLDPGFKRAMRLK